MDTFGVAANEFSFGENCYLYVVTKVEGPGESEVVSHEYKSLTIVSANGTTGTVVLSDGETYTLVDKWWVAKTTGAIFSISFFEPDVFTDDEEEPNLLEMSGYK